MSFRIQKMGLSVLAAAALVACGGGSDPQTTEVEQPATVNFTGTVVDGYIQGATVCLDLNNNQACDTGEPSTTSGANGAYSLDVTKVDAAKLKVAHLFTTVPDTAKDSDDGGKTLKEAGKSAFNLLAPAAAFVASDGKLQSAVISPLTTLVSHDMLVGGKSLALAKTAVASRVTLKESDLMSDTVKAGGDVLKKARIITVTIGEVAKQALAVSGTSNKEAMLAAMGYAQQNIAALQALVTSDKPADILAKVKTETDAKGTGMNKPVIADLVNAVKVDATATPVSFLDSLATSAWYDFNDSNVAYYKTAGVKTGNSVTGLTNTKYVKSGTQFITTGSSLLALGTQGWLAETKKDWDSSLDAQGNFIVTMKLSGYKTVLSARELDLNGKTLAAALPQFKSSWLSTTGLTFGPGAKAVLLNGTALQDTYWMDRYGSSDTIAQYVGSVRTDFTTLESVVQAFPTSTAPLAQNILERELDITFDAGGTSAGGTVTLWSFAGGGAATKVGHAAYENRTVNGVKVLVVKASIPARGADGFILTEYKGAVYSGWMEKGGVYRPWHPSFNLAAMKAIWAVNPTLPALVE